jgi:hypothetical protein
MTLPKDEIVWDWNTTKFSAGQIARKYGTTRNVILGIVHRDPRAIQRRQLTPLQKAQKRIKALQAEVERLQALEVAKAHSARNERKAAA